MRDRSETNGCTIGTHDLVLALFEPDQPGNTGTILRLGACLNVPIHIIEPAGFALTDKALRRAGMDYAADAWRRHDDWPAFQHWCETAERRIVLATTKGAVPHTAFRWRPSDVILLGSESRGVPAHVHDRADGRVVIPMAPAMRSLNVAVAGGMVLGEALRRVGAFD